MLLMCHATGFHGRTWIPTAKRLNGDFHCVAFDFRGHGSSELPDGADLNWSSFAQDLLAVIQAISPDEPVRAVGHSLGGGCIALAEAAAPGTILKAWAFEPILFGTDPSSNPSPLSEGARRRRPDFDSLEAAKQRYGSRPPFDKLHPEALEAYVRYGFRQSDSGGVTLCCAPETEATVFENHAAGSREAAIGMLTPYAVVAGNEEDGPAWLARDVAAMSDNITLFEMDLSHFGPMEDPDAIATAIKDWFRL